MPFSASEAREPSEGMGAFTPSPRKDRKLSVKIALGIKIAKKTLRIVVQNIVFAIGIKLLFLLLGALGVANMWEAVFADVGVTVIAILNSLRAMRVK